MRLYIIISILLFGILQESYAQRWKRDRHHLIGGLGAAGFMGDLGGAEADGSQGMRDYDFASTRPAGMLGYKYLLLEDLALTGNLSFGFISGNDAMTENVYRNNRNIHFRSPILELSSHIQYYVLNTQREGARYRSLTGARGNIGFDISAYVFLGVAGFYFNPQGYFDPAEYQGTIAQEELPSGGWYNLRPLKTEGQGYFPTRKEYLPVSVAIPFGIGGYWQLTREIALGMELGFRKTFTNYIDDVATTYVDPTIFHEMFAGDAQKIALAEHFSNPTNGDLPWNATSPGQQRGNPYNNDTYFFTMLTVKYKFPQLRPAQGLPRF